ncbi:hypothetical protein CBL_00217 [Carabus blaptoides fortunei]
MTSSSTSPSKRDARTKATSPEARAYFNWMDNTLNVSPKESNSAKSVQISKDYLYYHQETHTHVHLGSIKERRRFSKHAKVESSLSPCEICVLRWLICEEFSTTSARMEPLITPVRIVLLTHRLKAKGRNGLVLMCTKNSNGQEIKERF